MNQWIEKHKGLSRLFACIILLLIWTAAALLLRRSVLLPTPWKVLGTLWQMLLTEAFWQSLLTSLRHIALGFLLAAFTGILTGLLSARYNWMEALLWPVMNLIKAVPVASFIILALIWIKSSRLSVFISFLMVLPIIYTNTLSGVKSMDPKLTEMARVFNVKGLRRIEYLWLPQIKPYLLSAANVSLGLAWKAGIAAEVIAVVAPSIGGSLYDAKIYLETPELFAWTLTIIVLSLLFEKTVVGLITLMYKRLEAK